MGKGSKGRGHRSKGGRPRKAGKRYPSGKLIPQKDHGNDRVRQDREAALGDGVGLHNAENPLDLALARGWLTERQHRAAMNFVRMRRQARLGSPGLDQGGPVEVSASVSDVGRKGMQDWTDTETATVFDAAFNVRDPVAAGAQTAAAFAQWSALNAVMAPAERAEVNLVCVQGSWPQWVVQRCAGHMETAWEHKRDLLVSGLDKIAAILSPPKPKPLIEELKPSRRRSTAPKREESTVYVDEAGEVLLEVIKRRSTHGA